MLHGQPAAAAAASSRRFDRFLRGATAVRRQGLAARLCCRTPPPTTTTRLCTSDGMPCHLLRDAAVDVWGCLTAINCAVCDGQQRAWPRRSAAVCRPAVRPPHKTLNAMPAGRAQPSCRVSYPRAAWGRAHRELTRAVEQGYCQHSRNETYEQETAGRMAVRRRGKPHNRRPEPLKGAERGRKRAAYKKCLARGARVRKKGSGQTQRAQTKTRGGHSGCCVQRAQPCRCQCVHKGGRGEEGRAERWSGRTSTSFGRFSVIMQQVNAHMRACGGRAVRRGCK